MWAKNDARVRDRTQGLHRARIEPQPRSVGCVSAGAGHRTGRVRITRDHRCGEGCYCRPITDSSAISCETRGAPPENLVIPVVIDYGHGPEQIWFTRSLPRFSPQAPPNPADASPAKSWVPVRPESPQWNNHDEGSLHRWPQGQPAGRRTHHGRCRADGAAAIAARADHGWCCVLVGSTADDCGRLSTCRRPISAVPGCGAVW
jgi:hypothetical protein